MLNSLFINAAVSNGMTFLKPLYWLFGKCMEGLMFVFNDQYFLALIVFTVLTRLILFPINIRQQRTMAKTTRMQPKIQKIQKKYANVKDPRERQKMNEEMNALYAREGHNPMNMGCGPMLFQMVFLMGIIGIIYYPVEYIIGIDLGNQSDAIVEAIGAKTGARYYFQLDIIQNFDTYKEVLTTKFADLFTPDKVNAIEQYRSHLNIGSIDMTQTPHWKDGIIVIFPILCLVTSLASSVVSTLIQKKNNPSMSQQNSQMMMMMLMMPLFSFWFSFQVPVAVGFYWIISSIVAIFQQLVMAWFFPPKRNIARSMIENTIERRSREVNVKSTKK